MFLKLRILFTVISAVCLALAIPLGAAVHYIWAIGLGLTALLFFGLMLLCKQSQEAREAAAKPPEADFLHPKPETPSEKKDERNGD